MSGQASSASPGPLAPRGDIHFMIARASVEKQDVSTVLRWLTLAKGTNAQSVWNARQRISLSFDGYNYDRRELWEIRDVRRYVKKLLRAWPDWMFFVHENDPTLRTLCLCSVLVDRVANSDQFQVVDGLSEFFRSGFAGLNRLFVKHDFPEVELNSISVSITAYFGISGNESPPASNG